MIVCNLRNILDNLDMTQKDLAKAVNAHESSIGKLCQNKCKRVDIGLINDICDYLSIELYELFTYRPTKTPK